MRLQTSKQDGRSFLIIQAQFTDELPALHAIANELVGPLDDGWTILEVEVATIESQDKVFYDGMQRGRSEVFDRLRHYQT